MTIATTHHSDFVSDCTRELRAAYQAGRAIAQSDAFRGLSLKEALQVQHRLMTDINESATVSKVGINPEGIGICAPIFASSCGESGHTFSLPATGFLGIEVEIAVRLSSDVTPQIASGGLDSVIACIESFHVGVELVGTRLANREEAGPHAQLADNLNACGYVHSQLPFPGMSDISGSQVEIIIDGKSLDLCRGVSAFGNILNPIVACGIVEEREFDGLKAGMLVTTGALSGLIKVQGPARICAGVTGVELVELQLR